MEPTYILCADWPAPDAVVPIIQTCCSMCSRKLAMDAANAPIVQERGFSPISNACLLAEMKASGETADYAGVVIGGDIVPDFGDAIERVRRMISNHRHRN